MENKKVKVDELVIDGTTYVPKESIQLANTHENMDYVLVRTYSAGVHCGYLKSRKGKEVELIDSIRIWEWYGAASLSQLAMEGVKEPEKCKFAMPVINILLTEAIEIINMTEMAKNSILNVKSWKR